MKSTSVATKFCLLIHMISGLCVGPAMADAPASASEAQTPQTKLDRLQRIIDKMAGKAKRNPELFDTDDSKHPLKVGAIHNNKLRAQFMADIEQVKTNTPDPGQRYQLEKNVVMSPTYLKDAQHEPGTLEATENWFSKTAKYISNTTHNVLVGLYRSVKSFFSL